MWDGYPQGFDCANPTEWPEINSASLASAHQVFPTFLSLCPGVA